MGVPAVTVRGIIPAAAFFLKNGFRALLTFHLDPTIRLWEKNVTPPGFDGQAPVDLYNQWWTKWTPQCPRGQAKMTEAQMIVAYDPAVLPNILAAINREDTITINFPNGTFWPFFGFLQRFTPGEMVDGTQPSATAIIVPTIYDGSSTTWIGIESPPVYAGS